MLVGLRKSSGEVGVMTEPDYQRYKQMLDGALTSRDELMARIRQINAEVKVKTRMKLKVLMKDLGYGVDRVQGRIDEKWGGEGGL
jgi:hypothetical protein